MKVTETENKTPQTEPTQTPAKKKLPVWAKAVLAVVIVLAALAGLAALYINGKLDLLHYNDGSVTQAGDIDAEEDQDDARQG